MSIKYDLFENPPHAGKKEEGWLHARPVIQGTLKTDDLIDVINANSTVTGADVVGVLESLSEHLADGLGNSYNVYLEGIGTFSVTLKSRPVKDKKEIRAASVEVKNIEFRPDPDLKRKVQAAGVVRVEKSKKRKKIDEEERKQRILVYINMRDSINVTYAMALNYCSHAKTKKDLLSLVESGQIKELHYGNVKVYIRVADQQDREEGNL